MQGLEVKKSMRFKCVLTLMIVLLVTVMIVPSIFSKDGGLPSELSGFDGKWFKGTQDSEFKNYDLALRNYLVKRIKKQYGLELDPNAYSGIDLLELGSLIRCKKSKESFDFFLKMFRKTQ
jgi:hypothetical protein